MKAKLKDAMKSAMKAKEKLRLETIRATLSAIQYEEMQKGTEDLPDIAITAIIKNELKKRRESIEFSSQANRPEEVSKLEEEAKVLEEFLPKQLSAEDLEKTIIKLKAEGISNLGDLMKKLKTDYDGNYDGKLASEIAKRVLV